MKLSRNRTSARRAMEMVRGFVCVPPHIELIARLCEQSTNVVRCIGEEISWIAVFRLPERRAAADDVEGPTPVRLDQTPEKLIRIRHRKVALPWVQDDAAPPLGSRAMLREEVDP